MEGDQEIAIGKKGVGTLDEWCKRKRKRRGREKKS